MRRLFPIVIAGLFATFVACGESPGNENDIGDVGEDTFDDTDSQQPPKDTDDTDTKDSGDTPQEAEVTDDDPGQDDHEPPNPCVDPDGDGYGPECAAGPDCAPDDPLRFRLVNLYVDADYDGHGTGDPQELCIGADVPPGWSTSGDDCDDNNPLVYPGAPEIADDGVANGCTGEDLTASTASGIFVSSSGREDGAGTREDPVKSITTAIQKAKAAQLRDIFVAGGEYHESLVVMHDIAIHGGYDPERNWDLGKEGTTDLVSTGPVAIRVMESSLVLNRIYVDGYHSSGGPSEHTTASGVIIEEGKATIVESHILGCGITTTVPDNREVSCKGLWAINSEVGVFYTDISAGSLSIKEDSVIGPVERNSNLTAVVAEQSKVLIRGLILNSHSKIEIKKSAGAIKAKSTARYLDVSGGEVKLVNAWTGGTVRILADEVDAQDDDLQLDLVALGRGITISDQGKVYLINCQISSVQSEVESNTSITSANPIEASISQSAVSNAVTVSNGNLVSLNSYIKGKICSTELQHDVLPDGSNVSEANLVTQQALDVGQEGTALVANTLFDLEWDNTDDKSNLIRLLPGASLYMTHDVFWGRDGDFCRVNDGTSCIVQKSDGDFTKCTAEAGCLLIEDVVEADPKYVSFPTKVEDDSPLLDKGIDPAELGFNLFKDFFERDRPKGAAYDIGHIEFE